MVSVKEKQFLIDGKPQLILAGEIHYYRLEKEDWQDRVTKLKEAGFNTVSSYIPWLCHEETEGEVDLYGNSREELDLAGFIDLCNKNDLYFIARPGPFIMAEMKNEGIPYWVADKYPHIVPVTWKGEKVKGAALDYLAPEFLECTKRWYEKVMPLIGEHLYDKGGNIIAVQLDNEIGMLSWCTNSPQLSKGALIDFREFLCEKYTGSVLTKRYPFYIKSDIIYTDKILNPEEDYIMALHKDLGLYMRYRFLKYVLILTNYAKLYGVKDIPYLINIHGTSAGRGLTFPIGISQLYEACNASSEHLAGSDLYLGSLSMDNFQDLYIINTYMEAMNSSDKPLTSLEFECGDANYGESYSSRTDVSAADFMTRMCIAQGHKLLNYYLFCGGKNYVMKNDYKDGNNRIACTGERHGFAAPVSPEGDLNYTYDRLARIMRTMGANADKLASMQEERDNIVLGFIPDYYMTEYCYPDSKKEKELQQELTRFRGMNGFERFGRGMLLKNYCFTSLDIQNQDINCELIKTIVVFSASYMAKEIQQRLVDFAICGGSVLLYGVMPVADMEGNPCMILKNCLMAGNIHYIVDSPKYFLSIIPEGYLKGTAEVRCSYAQTYEVENAQILMTTADTKKICAFEKKAGKGKILMLGTEYICHLDNITRMLESLGSSRKLKSSANHHGLFITLMKNKQSEAFLHILNLDGFEKETQIWYKEELLFEGKKLRIAAKDGVMLPLNMSIECGKIEYATAEILDRTNKTVTFRLTQEADVIVFTGIVNIKEKEDYKITKKDGRTFIRSLKNAKIDSNLIVEYE